MCEETSGSVWNLQAKQRELVKRVCSGDTLCLCMAGTRTQCSELNSESYTAAEGVLLVFVP